MPADDAIVPAAVANQSALDGGPAGLERARHNVGRALVSSGFPFGFALACLITTLCIANAFSVSASGASGRLLITAMIVNTALIFGLGMHLVWQILVLRRGGTAGAPTPKLHLRLVSFLSFAAVLPAIVIAFFIGVVFVRALDTWFSQRVESVLEGGASAARAYVEEQGDATARDIAFTARDLNQPDAITALRANRITYTTYLRQQAVLRSFAAAYVVDGEGAVLARAEVQPGLEYAPPLAVHFDIARREQLTWDVSRDGRLWILYTLEGYEDAYLLAIRQLNPEVMNGLGNAAAALASYREARERRSSLQLLVMALYAQGTLLILVGAAWLGLVAANRLVAPIGRLVRASERVRDGDLEARVMIADKRDELAILGRAFNDMTTTLQSQRSQLLTAKEEAEARQLFTEAVLAGVTAGVMGVNSAGLLTIANASALGLLDIADERAALGRPAVEIAPEFDTILAQALTSRGEVVEAQIDITRAGRTLNLSVRAVAPSDAGGGIVVTFDDVTRLTSAQRNAAWRDVARRIAHEIKNPLTPIQLSAERLQRKYSKEVTTDPHVFAGCTDTIIRQVADIGRMVDEFSQFARMPEPRLERVEIGEVARNVAFAQRVASPDVAVRAQTPDTPVFVRCDERLVAQALANVLKNAVEAVHARLQADPGGKGASGAVSVALTVKGERAVLQVTDNGIGWPQTQRERLLEPYMTTREKGTGLGLAIVRRVMEDHHGRLELADRTDGLAGAVVRLVLPLHDAARAEPPAVQRSA